MYIHQLQNQHCLVKEYLLSYNLKNQFHLIYLVTIYVTTIYDCWVISLYFYIFVFIYLMKIHIITEACHFIK